jgi:hypothetical protein
MKGFDTRGLRDTDLERERFLRNDEDRYREQQKIRMRRAIVQSRTSLSRRLNNIGGRGPVHRDATDTNHLQYVEQAVDALGSMAASRQLDPETKQKLDEFYRMVEYVPETPAQIEKHKREITKKLADITSKIDLDIEKETDPGARAVLGSTASTLRTVGNQVLPPDETKRDPTAHHEINSKERMAYSMFGLDPMAVRRDGFLKTLVSPFKRAEKEKEGLSLFDQQRDLQKSSKALTIKADRARTAGGIRYGHGDPRWERLNELEEEKEKKRIAKQKKEEKLRKKEAKEAFEEKLRSGQVWKGIDPTSPESVEIAAKADAQVERRNKATEEKLLKRDEEEAKQKASKQKKNKREEALEKAIIESKKNFKLFRDSPEKAAEYYQKIFDDFKERQKNEGSNTTPTNVRGGLGIINNDAEGNLVEGKEKVRGGITVTAKALYELIEKNEESRKSDWKEASEVWKQQLEVQSKTLKFFEDENKIDKDATDENNENDRQVKTQRGKSRAEKAKDLGVAGSVSGVEPETAEALSTTDSTGEETPKKTNTTVENVVGGAAAYGAVKTAGVVVGGGKKVAEKAGKSVLKKGIAKGLIKKIPVIGALAGLGFGAQRALAGDMTGAGMEVFSGLSSTLPGVGTASSLATDAALMARDVKSGSVTPAPRPSIDTQTMAPQASGSQQPPVVQNITNVTNHNTSGGGGGKDTVPILVRPTENSFLRFQDKKNVRLL